MTSRDGTKQLGADLEVAHGYGVRAASAGLQDPALGPLRLTGPGTALLAEAAVTSATPFLRAPLLARVSEALTLHPPAGDPGGDCPSCGIAAPCPTATVLTR